VPTECQVFAEGGVVIHALTSDQVYRRVVQHCYDCDRRRRHAIRYDGYYRGYSERCLGCGTFSMDGCSVGEPDRTTARQWWDEAIPPREFDRRVRAIQRSYQEAM
jgi:hypothetical protein